jgi:competence protein ComEA
MPSGTKAEPPTARPELDYTKIVLGCFAMLVVTGTFAATEAVTGPKPTPTQHPPVPSTAAGEPKTMPAAAPAERKATSSGTTSSKKPAPAKPVKKVDINNATLAELRAVPLGEAEAQKVIAHRPYKARGELMTKAGLPEGLYLTIKDRLELQEPRKPAAAKK